MISWAFPDRSPLGALQKYIHLPAEPASCGLTIERDTPTAKRIEGRAGCGTLPLRNLWRECGIARVTRQSFHQRKPFLPQNYYTIFYSLDV